jgi:hypothetical protein
MSTSLEMMLAEAAMAEAAASAAALKAQETAERARRAQERAQLEREARRRTWAESVTATYNDDLPAAEAKLREAREAFNVTAVSSPADSLKAYFAWAEAAINYQAVQEQFRSAASVLGLTVWNGTAISSTVIVMPSPYSEALDAAIQRHVENMSADARDARQARIDDMWNGRGLDDGR